MAGRASHGCFCLALEGDKELEPELTFTRGKAESAWLVTQHPIVGLVAERGVPSGSPGRENGWGRSGMEERD